MRRVCWYFLYYLSNDEVIQLLFPLRLLPDVFLFISNFGSNATSLVESENTALHLYWYFMVLNAIIGSSIAVMAIEAYNNGSIDFYDNLTLIAQTIPVKVSSTWTNWIILRTSKGHQPIVIAKVGF